MAIDLKKLQKLIDDMSEEDLEKFFPEDNRPKGWVDIEEHLPMFLAKDIQQGFSRYKVKDSSGYEFDSCVTDHNMWYYYAKEVGITHWWNDKEWEGDDDNEGNYITHLAPLPEEPKQNTEKCATK